MTTTLDRLQGRIEALYVDKLDGLVDTASFESLAAKWSKEKEALAASIAEHKAIRSSYAGSCQTISNAVSSAQAIFSSREPMEQRRLIETFVERSEWREGALKAHLRAPFDRMVLL